MAPMSRDPTDEPARSDPLISERTAETYREHVISELEAENERLRERTDTLQRWLDERTSELRAFGIAAQAVQGARRVVRRPSLLARVPRAALRAVRGGSSSSSPERRVGPVAPSARRLGTVGASGRISAAREPSSLTVALIADESLALALAPECRVLRITPEDWQASLAASPPDLLVVESAWRGNGGTWQYRIAWYGHPMAIGLADLRALTESCAANGVPSVFWETAGLVGRGRFDEAASLFDVILTTDPAALAYYESLPTRRASIVDLLEPGVQFRRHHPPLASEAAAGRPVFVGSYDRARPLPDREALDRLLDAGLGRGLLIYDTGGVAGPDAPGFPERFRSVVQPFVPTLDLPDVLRAAAAVLVDAPGGDSEVVVPALLEALACGTPVVSTPNAAIQARFGPDVRGSSPADDPGAGLDAILADPTRARWRIRRSVLPMVARDYWIRDRLGRLAAAAGIATTPTSTTIAVAIVHDTPSQTVALLGTLARLGPVTEFLVGTSDWAGAGSALAEALRDARPLVPVRLIEQVAGATLAERLERLAAVTEVDWIAAWSGGPPPPRAPGDPDPLEDQMDVLLLATAFEPGDQVWSDDARLPLAVRRQSVLAGGWPTNRSADPNRGRIAAGELAR